MFRRNEEHRQAAMFSSIYELPEKQLKRLEESWAGVFYKEFFTRVEEDLFAVLYSDEPSRPNIPVNVLMGLVGRKPETLAEVKGLIGSAKIAIHALNVEDRDSLLHLLNAYDVGVSTLPDRRTSYALVDAAVYAGLDIVDMLEEFHRRPDPYETEGLQIPEGMGPVCPQTTVHERETFPGVR